MRCEANQGLQDSNVNGAWRGTCVARLVLNPYLHSFREGRMISADNVIVDEREWKKPFPSVDHDNREFWDGLKRHKLLLWRCKGCKTWYWPKAYCNKCEDAGSFACSMGWEEASGRGKLFAFNIHNIAFDS